MTPDSHPTAHLATLLGRAGSATLALAAVQASVAWASSASWAATIGAAVPRDGTALTPARLGSLLDALLHGSHAVATPLALVGVYWLCTPLFALAWMRAMAAPGGLGAHLRVAAHRYLTALALGALVAVVWALLLVGLGCVLWSCDRARSHAPDLAILAVSTAASVVVAASVLLCATFADLCRAALAVRACSLRQALGHAASTLGPRLVVHRLASASAGGALVLAGELCARASGEALAPLIAPVAIQASAFAALLARGHFLAAAAVLARGRPSPTPSAALSPR